MLFKFLASSLVLTKNKELGINDLRNFYIQVTEKYVLFAHEQHVCFAVKHIMK